MELGIAMTPMALQEALPIRNLLVIARIEYRLLKIPQTESWQRDGPDTLQRLCKGTAARRLLRMHATNGIGHVIGDLYRATKSYGGGHGICNTIYYLG